MRGLEQKKALLHADRCLPDDSARTCIVKPHLLICLPDDSERKAELSAKTQQVARRDQKLGDQEKLLRSAPQTFPKTKEKSGHNCLLKKPSGGRETGG